MAKFRAAALMGAVAKAKDYARKNPEKTSEMIGKVEGFARSKAGTQHADKVGKGGDAIRKGLGIPTGPQGHGVTGPGTSGGGHVPPPPPPSGTGPTS